MTHALAPALPRGDAGTGPAQLQRMTERQRAAARLRQCEEAYRRAQRGRCEARYRAALEALREAERVALALLSGDV